MIPRLKVLSKHLINTNWLVDLYQVLFCIFSHINMGIMRLPMKWKPGSQQRRVSWDLWSWSFCFQMLKTLPKAFRRHIQNDSPVKFLGDWCWTAPILCPVSGHDIFSSHEKFSHSFPHLRLGRLDAPQHFGRSGDPFMATSGPSGHRPMGTRDGDQWRRGPPPFFLTGCTVGFTVHKDLGKKVMNQT